MTSFGRKPDYAAKNRNGGFFQHRKPLGYKANSVTESVMVYRKKTDKLIDWNIRQYDDETVDASRVMGDYEKTNLWPINPATDKVHPAVFPPELAGARSAVLLVLKAISSLIHLEAVGLLDMSH